MKNKYLFLILINLVIYQSLVQGQKTNFELADSLIYLSAKAISENVTTDGKYTLNFNTSESYSVLKSKVISYLQKFDVEMKETLDEEAEIINYNLDELRVNYSDSFRDGFLGEYVVTRTAELNGSYNVSNSNEIGEAKKFYFNISDSLVYSDVSKVENLAYTFTTAELPEEPFFSSTLEPILAVGTAAVAVYLFFNIRSK